MNSLEEVAHQVKNCTGCPLHSGRANAVPGEGDPSADIMFIGEGPGRREDREGRPFVGPAGQLLEGLLASIGSNRNEVFIANMVKCRPPDNRDPAPAEMAACGKYLERQIELVDPKLIVTLGRFSFGKYFPGEGITRARGKLREKDGRKIFPVLHPAAVLRRQELRPIMVDDFRKIAEILAKTDQALPQAAENGVPKADKSAVDAPVAEARAADSSAASQQMGQLSFVSPPAPETAAPAPEPATATGAELARPEQLTLF